jgi:hypothetical protein
MRVIRLQLTKCGTAKLCHVAAKGCRIGCQKGRVPCARATSNLRAKERARRSDVSVSRLRDPCCLMVFCNDGQSVTSCYVNRFLCLMSWIHEGCESVLFGWMERIMWIVEVVQRVLSGHVLDHNPKRMLISKTKVNVSSQSWAHCDFLC